MKNSQKSIRTSAQAILAVAFLALGLNCASAQTSASATRGNSDTTVSGVATTSLVPGDWSGTGD